jgi:hypothetical protein
MDFFKNTNWAYFINGFKSLHNDEDYDKKFPLYAEELMKYDDLYIFLVLAIDEACNKKEAMNYLIETFIKAILDDSPLIYENLDTYIDIIHYMIGLGAFFPIELVFQRKYKDKYIDILEETSDYRIRAKLIDTFADKDNLRIKEYINSIPETIGYFIWKDIPVKSEKEIDEEDPFAPVSDLYRYSVLKFYSEYLKLI